MRLLQLSATAERGSEHPIGKAIVRAAEERGLDIGTPSAFQAVTGHGITAEVGKNSVVIGNLPLMQQHNICKLGPLKQTRNDYKPKRKPFYGLRLMGASRDSSPLRIR